MAITNTFRECVDKGEVERLRIMMSNSLLLDYSFAEFDEMENLARNVPDLYEKQDDRQFIEDPAQWNDDYIDRLDADLVFNFSHERIEHLKKVIQYLHPTNVAVNVETQIHKQDREKGNQKNNYSRYQEQKHQDQLEGRIIKIVSGATVGGIAGGAISGAAGGSVIAGAVVGAVVVGGVVALATKQK